jgi:hypothetical protein
LNDLLGLIAFLSIRGKLETCHDTHKRNARGNTDKFAR